MIQIVFQSLKNEKGNTMTLKNVNIGYYLRNFLFDILGNWHSFLFSATRVIR
jgi:hypothetical protein